MQAYEHILEGFEDIPSAFLSMMEGESQVKTIDIQALLWIRIPSSLASGSGP